MIKIWNEGKTEKVKKYLVIDDDVFDIKPYISKSRIIHTDVRKGLTEKDLEKIKVYFEKHKSIERKNVREKL